MALKELNNRTNYNKHSCERFPKLQNPYFIPQPIVTQIDTQTSIMQVELYNINQV